jgi:hypothetical protein
MTGETRKAVMIGCLVSLLVLALHLTLTSASLAGLIQPGDVTPAGAIVLHDLGMDPATKMGTGHDAQYSYMMARSPFDRDLLAETLERPLYRLQRPMLAALAWILHPVGGGPGLALALIGVVFASSAGAALATASLARRVGAPVWVAGVVPLLPGAWWSMRLTLADGLASALLVAALSASLAGRHRRAVFTGIAAVLAKEVVILAFFGLWLWRRDRGRAMLLAIPTAVASGWALALRIWMGRIDGNARELALPFQGIAEAIPWWWNDAEPLAALSVFATLTLAVAAFAWRRAHPLTWAGLAQIPLLVTLDVVVLSHDHNATRSVLPMLIPLGLALATPRDRADQWRSQMSALPAALRLGGRRDSTSDGRSEQRGDEAAGVAAGFQRHLLRRALRHDRATT